MEENCVGGFLAAKKDSIQLFRQSKDNMKIAGIQAMRVLLFNPLFPGKCLTFWTMTVTAGIIGDFDKTTMIAGVQMSSQYSSPAITYGTESLRLNR